MADTNLLKGLTNKSPAAPSEKPKGPSVNQDATRTSVAPQPKSLGPRCA
jgi:hypothetical protein